MTYSREITERHTDKEKTYTKQTAYKEPTKSTQTADSGQLACRQETNRAGRSGRQRVDRLAQMAGRQLTGSRE